MNLYLSYLFVILGVLVTAFVFDQAKWLKSSKFMSLITVFGGAFLLAVCFLNLAPHVYESAAHSHECSHGEHSHFFLNVGAFVLLGFLIQLILEMFTKGTEHGHFHGEENASAKQYKKMVFPLLIGVCVHAFLEGMPISHGEHVQVGLVWGIIIHNIPITIILANLFGKAGYSFGKVFLLLFIFAIMTPLGSLVNNTFLANITNFESIITALVIGVLLHVSVNILFFDEQTQKNKKINFIVILSAFILAYFLPACSH